MKEQIQQLIANGQTEEALATLATKHGDAVLLQGRYNNGKKQYNMGLIEFSEWQRVQAQINYAALELASSVNHGGGGTHAGGGHTTTQPAAPEPPPANGGKKPVVFISYNHEDAAVARRVTDYLEANGVDVIIDEDDMDAGMSIMQFIQNSIKTADAVVSIVSSKSLQSGWVGQESVASIYAVWLADKNFIPVRLDSVAFDIKFQIAAQRNIQTKIEELEADIAELRKVGGDSRAFDDDRNRLFELRNNLGQIIQRLKNVLMVDISEPNFDANIKRVLDKVKKVG